MQLPFSFFPLSFIFQLLLSVASYIPRILYSFCHSYCSRQDPGNVAALVSLTLFIFSCLMKCFSVNKASVCAWYYSCASLSACSNLVGLGLHWTMSHTQQRGFTPEDSQENKNNLWTRGLGLLPSSFVPVTVNDVIAMHVALCKSLKYALLSTDLRGKFACIFCVKLSGSQ